MTVTVLEGDVIAKLKEIPSDTFGVIVTSPPYWGLRDYGVDGQLGMEPTLSEHLSAMIAVFDEIWRVLKPDGTCWVNYGDCYATTPNGRSAADVKAAGKDDRTFRDKPFSTIQGSLKPKDLCMVPNRFAIAMQDAGWWVRSEIIWAKPNPMPESVTDRPATAHEKVFMFTKAGRYFYQPDEVRQRRVGDEDARTFRGGSYTGGRIGNSEMGKRDVIGNKRRGHKKPNQGFNDRWDQMSKAEQQENGRNLRNYEPAPMQVWEIATRPFKEAHFATFPPELVKRCLDASLRPGDAVLDPFGGAGTTGLVAASMGADCTLIEISHEYCDLIRARLASGLVSLDQKAVPPINDDGLWGWSESE